MEGRLVQMKVKQTERTVGFGGNCRYEDVFVTLGQEMTRLCVCPTGGLFPTGSHEYEVFRFALAQHQDVPKLVPQVDMVDTASSFSMTYACEFFEAFLLHVEDKETDFYHGSSGMPETGGMMEPVESGIVVLDLFINIYSKRNEFDKGYSYRCSCSWQIRSLLPCVFPAAERELVSEQSPWTLVPFTLSVSLVGARGAGWLRSALTEATSVSLSSLPSTAAVVDSPSR